MKNKLNGRCLTLKITAVALAALMTVPAFGIAAADSAGEAEPANICMFLQPETMGEAEQKVIRLQLLPAQETLYGNCAEI